jgi:hypothetical protein
MGIADFTSFRFLDSIFSAQYFDEVLHFYNQGADIELIAVLVNKKH